MKRRRSVPFALALLLGIVAASAQTIAPGTRGESASLVALEPAVPADGTGATRHDALAACRAALSRPPQGQELPYPTPLRVMSWNTMKYAREGSRGLIARISDHVDLVLLQEATRRDEPARGEHWHRYFADGYRTWSNLQTGVELRSRYAADTVCHLSFTEPWLRSPKAVLVARLPFADSPLLLVNLHAINFTLTADAYAAQLEAIGELLAAHTGPVIVAGDFNNWNSGRQRALEDFAHRHGLSIAQFEPDWRSRHLGVPVDGLLQRGLDVRDATALPTSRSDHHPLIVLLQR